MRIVDLAFERSFGPNGPIVAVYASVTKLGTALFFGREAAVPGLSSMFSLVRRPIGMAGFRFRRPTRGLMVAGMVLAAGSLSLSINSALAEEGADAHSAHHPSGAPSAKTVEPPSDSGMAQAPPPSNPPSSPPKPAMGGMGEMMGEMMKPPGKQFYPSLMNMPTLTPEARQYIEREAQQRLSSGTQSITAGQADLHHAMAQNDAGAMQKATAGVRGGLLQAESGAAALRALSDGQAPRQFALTWFRGQMSLPGDDTMFGPRLWGLSWYHFLMMAFLLAFLLGAVLIHYSRLRNVAKLVQRLTPPDPSRPVAGVAPPSAAGAAAAVPAPTPQLASPLPTPARTPVAPVVPLPTPAAGSPASAPKRPWSGPLRVAAIFQETPNVKTFRFVGTDATGLPFTFIPGQFLTFKAEVDGKLLRRSYTIASSPTQQHYLEITVKREDLGAESRYLHDHVAIGDRVEVSGPSGLFTFTSVEADSIVLIGGGVGITPLMCIVRYLTDRAFPGDIYFLYAARSPQDFIFREELDYLEKRHKNLHISATMARADASSWTGKLGFITKEFIADAVPDISRRRVHVCGPPPMMEAVKAQLLELGVPQVKIKTEAFGAALGAAPAPAPAASAAPVAAAPSEAVASTAAPAAAEAATSAPSVPSAQVEVQFSKSGKTGPLAPDQSVLEAAEAIGVAIDFSCRVGTCGTCVVPLLKGTVTMAVEDGLDPADKARGIILACQAKSAGALVVDA